MEKGSESNERAGRVDWKAQWIWQGDEPAPYHFFLYMRRTFERARPPLSAVLHITATDRYRLFVNGVYLGRGPERCDPRFQSYDSYELTRLLTAGANCIAVQVYFYGCQTGFTRDGRGGLLAQLEIKDSPGSDIEQRSMICTDNRWKAMPAKAWRRDAKTTGIGIGVTEVFDARLDPPDWMMPGFDDSAWEPAGIVPVNSGQWCGNPEPRHIPFLEEKEIRPARFLGKGEVLELDGARSTADIAELIAREIHEELRHARLENAEALVAEALDAGVASFPGPAAQPSPAIAATSPYSLGDDVFDGIRDPFVLLDFGRQVNAFPRLTVEGGAGSIVDIAYGEQLVGGRIAPLICASRCAERYIMRDGQQTFECFDYKSFRYMQLTFRTDGVPVKIHSVGANTWRYPARPRGSFQSSDPVLTSLWAACAATTDLCTDDAFMDSPLREKRNWLGDGSHALLGAIALWGDVEVMRRYFQLVAQGALGDGMLRMFFPGGDFMDQKTKIVSTIPQHALVWASRVWEYHWFFGRAGFLEGMYPTLLALAGWCDRHVNSDGLLDRLPNWSWLDWSPADIRGANFGTNAFMLHMLDDLSMIAGTLGRDADAARWAEKAAGLRTALRRIYWDQDRGVFLDSIFCGKPTGIASELGNALSLLYDIADEEQGRRVAGRLQAGAGGLAPATPLFFHYVPQSLFRHGRAEAAIRLISERFARMMAVSGTIWEGWNRHAMLPQITEMTRGAPETVPDGSYQSVVRNYNPCAIALAHCGGVGSGLLLLTEVLGIKPRRPGFDGCILKPLVNLLDSAAGVFPSPTGDISVSWKKTRDRKTLTLSLPAGMSAELRLPDGRMVQLAEGKHSLEVEDTGSAISR